MVFSKNDESPFFEPAIDPCSNWRQTEVYINVNYNTMFIAQELQFTHFHMIGVSGTGCDKISKMVGFPINV